jgi:hypothetical protein
VYLLPANSYSIVRVACKLNHAQMWYSEGMIDIPVHSARRSVGATAARGELRGRMQFVSNKIARSGGHLLGTHALSAAAVPLHAVYASSGCCGPFYDRLPLGPTLASANSKALHMHRV